LITYGSDFEEARLCMRNALSEFNIEGINTTIPIHKTIIEEQNFINGIMSTNYIEKYDIMQKMLQRRSQEYESKSHAAVSALLLQTEYVKKYYSDQNQDKIIQNSSRGNV
jgi:acetyl-CoA/propionyl-CoA carboxylase